MLAYDALLLLHLLAMGALFGATARSLLEPAQPTQASKSRRWHRPADAFAVIPSVFALPTSGLGLASIGGYALGQTWIAVSLALSIAIGVAAFASVLSHDREDASARARAPGPANGRGSAARGWESATLALIVAAVGVSVIRP